METRLGHLNDGQPVLTDEGHSEPIEHLHSDAPSDVLEISPVSTNAPPEASVDSARPAPTHQFDENTSETRPPWEPAAPSTENVMEDSPKQTHGAPPEPHSEDEKIQLSEPVVSEVPVEEKPEQSAQAHTSTVNPSTPSSEDGDTQVGSGFKRRPGGADASTTLARLPNPIMVLRCAHWQYNLDRPLRSQTRRSGLF